jgi:hypothetical protein
MDGFIDIKGILNIKRKTWWVPQICKYSSAFPVDKHCGGSCPFFGVPNEMSMQTSLEICEDRTLYFDSFEIK